LVLLHGKVLLLPVVIEGRPFQARLLA